MRLGHPFILSPSSPHSNDHSTLQAQPSLAHSAPFPLPPLSRLSPAPSPRPFPLQVRAQGVQIVLADQMPHASYRPTYAAISYPYRLRHLAEAPYPPNTCFRTALFINAFTNSIAFNPNPNTSDCFSPVMIGVHK